MGMFKMEKPRRFNHQYIYVDERKEKLQKRMPSVTWVCFLRKSFLPKTFVESLLKEPST